MSNLAKKRSKIWNHFSVINKDKAKFEHCSKAISYPGSGTGNLTRHIKKLHVTVSIEQSISENPQGHIVLPSCAVSNGTGIDGVCQLVPSLGDKTAPMVSSPRQASSITSTVKNS